MCLRICPAASSRPYAQAVHADVVADGGEILHALANQRANQIFRNTAQPESANHDGRAVEDILDGFVGAGNNLIHRQGILNENHSLRHRTSGTLQLLNLCLRAQLSSAAGFLK